MSQHSDIHFRRIYEDNRSLPNDTELKSELMIFNMGVDFIENFMSNPKISFDKINENFSTYPIHRNMKIETIVRPSL